MPKPALQPVLRPGGYWRSTAALHGAVLLFGLAGLFGKWLALHPGLIVFGRVVVASAAFAVLLRFRPGTRAAPTGPTRALLALCGLVLAFHWFAFFHAIQLSTVAVGLLGYSTAPVFAVLLEPVWLAERFSRRSLLAALLTFAGVALIVVRWPLHEATALGVAWGVLAGASFAVLTLLNRGLVQRFGSVQVAFHQDAWAAVALLPVLPVFWQWPDAREVALLLVLGLLCTALAHALYIQSMLRVRAGVAAVSSAMEPVYGILLAFLLLGEVPALRTLAGGALILAAVVWISLQAEPGAPE